jgi:hypothetical protein
VSSLILFFDTNYLMLLQHHILDRHRRTNKEDHHIDDARFEEVGGLRVSTGGLTKQQKAEELWKAAFVTLFKSDVLGENDVPDPCMTRPNCSH